MVCHVVAVILCVSLFRSDTTRSLPQADRSTWNSHDSYSLGGKADDSLCRWNPPKATKRD